MYIRQTFTISLPADLKKELDRVIKQEGVSRSDIIKKSLRTFLFKRSFNALRARITAHARSRGVKTDEDVFDRLVE